jgi:flagellar basal body-associated protein FliL
MGRLDVHIRHGDDGGSGWVIALVVIIVLAAAGGAARKALTTTAHVIATAVEVITWTLAAVVILAAAAGVGYAAWRIRGAVRSARDRRAVTATVIRVTPERPGTAHLPPDDDRPAIGAPREARSWPLPGWWEEVRPQVGGDDEGSAP